jgi:hypothetical protein
MQYCLGFQVAVAGIRRNILLKYIALLLCMRPHAAAAGSFASSRLAQPAKSSLSPFQNLQTLA